MNTASVLRHVNVRNCLRLLRDRGPLSRADLARELGTTRTTVGYAIAELASEGLVKSAGNTGSTTGGRPGMAVKLDPQGAYFYGVSIETDHFTTVLADFVLERQAMARTACDLEATAPEDLCRAIVRSAENLASGFVGQRVFGLGVSMPGIITPAGRVILPGSATWSDVALQAMLEDAAPGGWVIRCCNDAVAFALGHADRLTASDKQDLLVVLLTRGGIGSVRMRGGVVDRGVHGIAGEIGLIHMEPHAGEQGRTFQSVALSILPGRALSDPGAPDSLWQDCEDALGQWAETMARGLLDAIYLIDPAKIVIMGALAPLFDRVGDRIRGHLRDWLMPGLSVPEIDVVAPQPDAAVIGAAALAREDLFALPRIGKMAAASD
jgi:predicted NBD/HSP70 family sugar kinase